MPAQTRGSVYKTRTGWGIRWPEGGQRRHQSGFRTRTEARQWFAETVAPRLRRGVPRPELIFAEFAELFLSRHGATVAERTVATLREA